MKPSATVDSVMLAQVTAATTERTANLDISDANYATIRLAISAEASTFSTNVVIALSESDDNVASNFATFDATFNRTVDNTLGTVATSHIDCEGRKKLIKLTVTPDTVASTGAVITSAVASLYKSVRSGTDSDYGPDVVIG